MRDWSEFFSSWKELLISWTSLPSWKGEAVVEKSLLWLMICHNFRTVVSKLLALGPKPCPCQFFCSTHFEMVRKVFLKKRYSTTCEIMWNSNFSVHKSSVYENTAMLFISELSMATMEELSGCDRDGPHDQQSLKYLLTDPLQRSLQPLLLGVWKTEKSSADILVWKIFP